MKEIKIKCRGVQAVIWGVQEFKKLKWAKRRQQALLGLEKEKSNRFGSSEPDRFRIVYIKGFPVFFLIFSFLSLSSLISRERGSAFSLESGSGAAFFSGG